VPPPAVVEREEEEEEPQPPTVPKPPVVSEGLELIKTLRKKTKRGQIKAQNPEYARFYEYLTAPERNALNVRRRDYIARLKMSPEDAIREAMQRHPKYAEFKASEDAEL
jgi:hypothetical protein